MCCGNIKDECFSGTFRQGQHQQPDSDERQSSSDHEAAGVSSPVTPSHCLLTAARPAKISPPDVTHDDVTTAGNTEQTSGHFSNVTQQALTTDHTHD